MPDSSQSNQPESITRNVLGAAEDKLAGEFAKSLRISGRSADFVLKNFGLSEIPEDVWEAVGNLKSLDVSETKVLSLHDCASQCTS